jgi:hypothetical protein
MVNTSLNSSGESTMDRLRAGSITYALLNDTIVYNKDMNFDYAYFKVPLIFHYQYNCTDFKMLYEIKTSHPVNPKYLLITYKFGFLGLVVSNKLCLHNITITVRPFIKELHLTADPALVNL